MAGLLGDGWEDPRSQAIMALSGGLLQGNFGAGLLGANQAFGEAKNNALKQKLLDAQLQETLAQAQERQVKTQREQEALRRQQAIQQALPGMFRQPGMTGGEAVPQSFGGTDVPMFSKPAGVTPMQQTPGGFDVQQAIRLGMKPEEIIAYAGLQDVGRPKATRQMEVDDGRGGKRIALVDDFGREVAGFNGYTAPVQVDTGRGIQFVKPQAGVSLAKQPTFSDSIAAGQLDLSRQRFAFDKAGGADASKPPTGYRWKADRTGLEAIPGGPADIKAGEQGAKAEARNRGAIAQADSVLGEIRAAKGLVGWNTAGVGGVMSVVPATDARNLSAKLQTIKANLGFDRLQQMRDQSPTGGALGQVAVQELAALQATVASLDQMQSPVQLGQALDKIERHYTSWRNTVQQAASGSGGASGGWSIREKK